MATTRGVHFSKDGLLTVPELPEVETMRRGIACLAGCRIVDVEFPPCTRRPILIRPPGNELCDRLRHRVVQRVGRLGKRILLSLDSGDTLVIEPRMTGLVLLADPPTTDHLRLRISFSSGGQITRPAQRSTNRLELLFWDRRGLGTVSLFSAAEMASKLGGKSIGPDALEIDASTLQERLQSSRRAIKVALLDQRALAGVGNLYASELLHLAKIHPQTPCDQLTRPQWQRLHRAMQDVLQRAIQYEGSTLSDGTYRNALNNPGSFQNQHRVYDRANQLCLTCRRGKIQRIVQCGRSTFYCPHCQKQKPV